MRPPYAYYGGKSGLAKIIAALMPEHRVYLEPFFGSGAVFFAKRPAVHEIVNDLDHAVVTFLMVLRDRREELEAVCALTPHARDEFDAAFMDDVNLMRDPELSDEENARRDLEMARRFWVRVNQSFAKTVGRQTGFSVTTGRTQAVPASIAGRLGRFEDCAMRLMAATIENTDAAKLIDRLATPDSVTYADPPYVADTRRSRRRGTACLDYRVDMGQPEEHERLAEALHRSPGAVMLSGYHSDLYDTLYKDWDRLEFQVHAHGSNSVARGARTEVLWANFELIQPDEQLAFPLA